jgi:hypothetical protein
MYIHLLDEHIDNISQRTVLVGPLVMGSIAVINWKQLSMTINKISVEHFNGLFKKETKGNNE